MHALSAIPMAARVNFKTVTVQSISPIVLHSVKRRVRMPASDFARTMHAMAGSTKQQTHRAAKP